MSELHSDRPYKCKVDIALPSSIYAKHLRDVLSVDGELGNKIVKSFSVVSTMEYGDDDDNVGYDDDDDVLRILRIEFAAVDAKMLRVAVSTTYDMITVALKCFQEFT
eukprot:scaffold23804_cov48-Cyclotella_meneghiniana.AAC.13